MKALTYHGSNDVRIGPAHLPRQDPTTNPGRGAILNKKSTRPGAGLIGYSHLYGGYPGGQAEYVRVPRANVGPLVIPDSTLTDEQLLFPSDILPTGYQAVDPAAFIVDRTNFRGLAAPGDRRHAPRRHRQRSGRLCRLHPRLPVR